MCKSFVPPKVSVIVPVYNGISFLKNCIEDLISQTLKDIEIIIIDDGSTDGTWELCEAYSQKYNYIKIIHNRHTGLSNARNIGIKFASASYIMFVDCDDRISKDFCRIPYIRAINYHADIVMFKCVKKYGDNKIYNYNKESVKQLDEGLISKEDAMLQILFSSDISVFAWNKLYKKELFNDIVYPYGRLYEDVGTTYKIVNKATRIYYLPISLYKYYLYREGSITGTKTIDGLNDKYFMWKGCFDDLSLWGYKIENRVLRKGGSFICSFPIDPNIELVDEDPLIKTEEERVRRFGQNDHLRVFGMNSDIFLAEAGFEVKKISGENCPKEILPVVGPADYDINLLFRCIK